MGVIQLPDGLQRVLERPVAEGRAANSAAFLEEAVWRLVDETTGKEGELLRAVEAGHYVTVATTEDERHIEQRQQS